MSRPSRRAGYTMIEIMISVVIMTIGAAGILAMQGASVRSNQDANETTAAVNFATTWIERIKRDARLWTAIGAPTAPIYLRTVNASPNVWVVPAATAPESAGADYFGFETPTNADGITAPLVRYCVNVRFNVAHRVGGAVDAVRADVLVWWRRSGANDTVNTAACPTALTNSQIASTTAADQQLRKHFLSTVVTWRSVAAWP